jgi:hypothetical protein
MAKPRVWGSLGRTRLPVAYLRLGSAITKCDLAVPNRHADPQMGKFAHQAETVEYSLPLSSYGEDGAGDGGAVIGTEGRRSNAKPEVPSRSWA